MSQVLVAALLLDDQDIHSGLPGEQTVGETVYLYQPNKSVSLA